MLGKFQAAAPKPAAHRLQRTKRGNQPALEDFVASRDFSGATALVKFKQHTGTGDDGTLLWLAYCASHSGDFKTALEAYEQYETDYLDGAPVHLYKAACMHFLQMHDAAEEVAMSAPDSSLKTRLLFVLANAQGDEKKLMQVHAQLTTSTEDQLTIAAVHYSRSQFQVATNIYKRLLLEHREMLAINVYVAMCYYKLDYYDVSLEILTVYLQSHPTSPAAINLKACNHCKLFNGKAAEQELKTLVDVGYNLMENDIIRHNLVVFRNGENALNVLPPLVPFIKEARLNLVIYYLKHDEVQEAYELLKGVEPALPQEYILKATVNAYIAQSTGSREHLKVAQQCFQLVGASAVECDTIPGRQCMASCFFLLRQFNDVNIYLRSIRSYLHHDDDFNWNFGISLAASGSFAEAESVLALVQNDRYRSDYVYLSWLARCYIMNGKAPLAWQLYSQMDSSHESFNLLQLIANDCYKMGSFYYAAKAFDVLERLDPDPEYWEGKRGACVGVFQQVVAGREQPDALREVLAMIRNTSNPQVEYIIRIITKWCVDHGVAGVGM